MEIRFNTDFPRWEVFPERPVIRGGKPQPSFVSTRYEECEMYVKEVQGCETKS